MIINFMHISTTTIVIVIVMTVVIMVFHLLELCFIGCSEIMCKCKGLYHEQEGGRKYWMHVRLKQFSVGKFMLHRCDSWGIENFCTYLNFCGPVFAGKWIETFFDDEFWATGVICGSAGNFTYSSSKFCLRI